MNDEKTSENIKELLHVFTKLSDIQQRQALFYVGKLMGYELQHQEKRQHIKLTTRNERENKKGV